MIIPENYYIFISAFIVAIYLAMIYFGYKKGFLYEMVSLLYSAASLLVAWFASPVFASLFPLFDISSLNQKYELIDEFFNLNKLLNTVAYFLIIFLLMKLLYIFVSLLVKSFNNIPVLGSLNRMLGAVFGVFNATLITLCLSMLLSMPLFKNGNAVKENTIFRYISGFSNHVLNLVVEKFSDSNIKNETGKIDIDAYREEFREWLISVSGSDE